MDTTKLLHLSYDGNFQYECEATIIACRWNTADEPIIEIILDATVMHPQGGGQPSDTGTISNENATAIIHRVTMTRDDTTNHTIIQHIGKIKSCSNVIQTDHVNPPIEWESIFPIGSIVKVSIDSDRRQLLSECHSAGHIVDSAMARCNRVLPPTKGYHFLDGPYVEYAGNIPPHERDEFLKELQAAFQSILQEDIATKIEHVSLKEAEDICSRIQLNFDISSYNDSVNKEIRIVTIADWPCPCGGTHIRSTGQLQRNGWSIIGIKVKKGVVRIRYGPTNLQEPIPT